MDVYKTCFSYSGILNVAHTDNDNLELPLYFNHTLTLVTLLVEEEDLSFRTCGIMKLVDGKFPHRIEIVGWYDIKRRRETSSHTKYK